MTSGHGASGILGVEAGVLLTTLQCRGQPPAAGSDLAHRQQCRGADTPQSVQLRFRAWSELGSHQPRPRGPEGRAGALGHTLLLGP